MKKAVLLITIVLLEITGCSQKSSVTEQTTAIETTVTMEAKSSDNTSLSAESETSDEADIYGNLGEDFFNRNVIPNWKNYTIPDEKDLREIMDAIYEDLPTKEDLIQIVLATPRDPQPTQSTTETQATQTPNSNNNTNGGSSNNGGNTTTPKETKATTPKETKSNTTETQAPAVDPEKKAKVDAKLKEWKDNPATVDNDGGAGGVNEGIEDAVKGWQWQ